MQSLHCIWYELKWNDLSLFIWFVYCTHSHDSYVYEDNTRTHHMFDDRNWHNISQHMILWRACFDMLQHVFMKKDYAMETCCVCVCVSSLPRIIIPGTISGISLSQQPPKISWIRLFNIEIWKSHSFSNVLSRFHPPPRPLVTIVPNICRYKMALEGLESLVGHGVAGPQQANGTGGR